MQQQLFTPGNTPISVVMITLNEAHNLELVFKNLSGWAKEILVLDSFSKDHTVDLCINNSVYVAQKKFEGFGKQWNAALNFLPISCPWTLKLDPDEVLTDKLKNEINNLIDSNPSCNGAQITRRLYFLQRRMPVRQTLTRLWRTGKCKFSDVTVNEHAIVEGSILKLKSNLEHFDSPNYEHWVNKQNLFSSAEAKIALMGGELSAKPDLFGNHLNRRMWIKKNFFKLPFRYSLLFLYNYLFMGAFLSGRPGYIWASSRNIVMKLIEYKYFEYSQNGNSLIEMISGHGEPDPRIDQFT